MKENATSFSHRDDHAPSAISRLLWWLATAETELIKDCQVDRNRYAIIGLTVLGTWLFATLAWTYFFSTVVSHMLIAIALGIFMGGIVLGIDRALIKGIDRHNKNKLLPFLFRGMLAFTIGLFMAQPALLYLFDKEVQLQISLDNEQKRRDKRQQQDSLYAGRINLLQAEKEEIQQKLTARYNEVAAARTAFIAETDGTGGTGKIGVAAVAAAKKREYERLQEDYQRLQATVQPSMDRIDSTLASIEMMKSAETRVFEALLNDGFLTRIEALHNLVSNNTALQYRYFLLVAILLLIELMPVIAKTLLPAGVYDEKVRLQQELELAIATGNQRRELALKESCQDLAFEKDQSLIRYFFEVAEPGRHERMQQTLERWKNGEGSFDDCWQEVKREMLIRQDA